MQVRDAIQVQLNAARASSGASSSQLQLHQRFHLGHWPARAPAKDYCAMEGETRSPGHQAQQSSESPQSNCGRPESSDDYFFIWIR